MLTKVLDAGLALAGIPAEEFDAAIRKAGYKSRLQWLLAPEYEGVLAAYNDIVKSKKDAA